SILGENPGVSRREMPGRGVTSESGCHRPSERNATRKAAEVTRRAVVPRAGRARSAARISQRSRDNPSLLPIHTLDQAPAVEQVDRRGNLRGETDLLQERLERQ